jgi:hypothetical protein
MNEKMMLANCGESLVRALAKVSRPPVMVVSPRNPGELMVATTT